jgi:hypothetical protein
MGNKTPYHRLHRSAEGIGKPDSVPPGNVPGGNDHSSRPVVAGGIMRPYPRIPLGRTTQPQGDLRRPRENPPIRSCSGWGLPAPWLTPRWSELLPRLFTLAAFG